MNKQVLRASYTLYFLYLAVMAMIHLIETMTLLQMKRSE